MSGFFMIQRNEATRELLRDPKAFTLLALIAYRAKWSNMFSVHDLRQREAFLGDSDAAGLTEQEYRTAKGKLAKWGLATFRPTNRGTVATLTSTSVFDINAAQVNGHTNTQSTDGQQTEGDQATTNNKEKNEKKGKGPRMFVSELKVVLDAKKAQASKMKTKYGFDYPEERKRHPREFAEYQKLWLKIKELQGKIQDFPT